ncbi:serine carboxypeptidase-like 47 [Amborella trichopoda]|uniref:serine carboxypeptidase-like 47 n=1 Tax=Amborella trichopoda TaxID=13333 RepID=UPI0009BE3E27|nr:serine carboxypeptidase-like 47 [Amborella trichopoda]|eukprot:XP_020520359.1 serine carboxypeptidase-like 47 [Amborella trichopoda]
MQLQQFCYVLFIFFFCVLLNVLLRVQRCFDFLALMAISLPSIMQGPFKVDDNEDYLINGARVKLNPYSWSKVSNLIYVDAPAGTGFSYADNSDDYIVDDPEINADIYEFILKDYNRRPSMLFNSESGRRDMHAQPALTVDQLQKKGIPIPNGCVICLSEEESNPHLFIHCSLVYDLWSQVLQLFHLQWVTPPSVTALISSYYDCHWTNACRILWKDAIAATIWVIWAFSGISANSFLSQCENILYLQPQKLQRPNNWLPPPEGIIKLNFDDCSLGNPGPVEAGGVFRDHHRNILFTYSEHLGYEDSQYAEAMALLLEVSGIWERCTKRLTHRVEERSLVEYHLNLTMKGYQAFIYNGDHDMFVSYLATMEWIKLLNYTKIEKWRPWFVGDQIAGYAIRYEHNLLDATFRGSGHTVPEYTPIEGLEAYRRWIDGSDSL